VGFPHAICTIPKSSPFLFGAINIQAIAALDTSQVTMADDDDIR